MKAITANKEREFYFMIEAVDYRTHRTMFNKVHKTLAGAHKAMNEIKRIWEARGTVLFDGHEHTEEDGLKNIYRLMNVKNIYGEEIGYTIQPILIND